MLVKIKRKAADLNISVSVGSTYDLPADIAQLLIDNNRADRVEKEKKPKVKTTVQSKARTRPVTKSEKRDEV